jgi:hypothetical protein
MVVVEGFGPWSPIRVDELDPKGLPPSGSFSNSIVRRATVLL